MSYRIAIPSYKRPSILVNRTLKFLDNHGIDRLDIDIFLANEAEFIEYERVMPRGYNYVIIGKPGIGRARQFMSEFYPNGQHIVYLDDDITNIKELRIIDGKKCTYPIFDFKMMIKFMFERLDNEGLALCGVSAVNNPFYLVDKITTDLKFIIGQFACVINDSDCEERHFNLLEDYERTCNYYKKYAGVVRYNNICLEADYNNLDGGVKAIHNRDNESKMEELKEFIEYFPEYATIKEKKNGYDIRLKGPKFKKKTISSFWYGRALDHIELNTIQSYLQKDYIFKLYIYENFSHKYSIPNGVKICNAESIFPSCEIYKCDNTICSFSDIWRYNLIYKTGETWCDMDMMLVNEIPNDEIITSSEFTNQTGALKCQELFRPNIGLLRFPKGSPFIRDLIDICLKKKATINISHMITFRKMVKKHGYEYDVSSPLSYCSVGWQHAQHLFKTSYNDLKTKFGVEPPMIIDILNNSICVHLWNNIYTSKKIKKEDIHPESLYMKLIQSILHQNRLTMP